MDLIEQLISQITLKDVADVLIVSMMTYQILKIVQGTRAVQILLGMVLLSFLYLLGINYNI